MHGYESIKCSESVWSLPAFVCKLNDTKNIKWCKRFDYFTSENKKKVILFSLHVVLSIWQDLHFI